LGKRKKTSHKEEGPQLTRVQPRPWNIELCRRNETRRDTTGKRAKYPNTKEKKKRNPTSKEYGALPFSEKDTKREKTFAEGKGIQGGKKGRTSRGNTIEKNKKKQSPAKEKNRNQTYRRCSAPGA